MKIYFTEKRGTLDPSDSEMAFIGLALVFVVLAIILLPIMLLVAIVMFTRNCYRLFARNGYNPKMCFVPIYNLYLCSKIITGHGMVLISMLGMFLFSIYSFLVTGGTLDNTLGGVGLAALVMAAVLVAYFNRKYIKWSGEDEGHGLMKVIFWILSVYPPVSVVYIIAYILFDMGKVE